MILSFRAKHNVTVSLVRGRGLILLVPFASGSLAKNPDNPPYGRYEGGDLFPKDSNGHFSKVHPNMANKFLSF